MDLLCLLAFSLGIYYWAYRDGKRDGSRRGYKVGRSHGQRRNRTRR